MGSNCSACWVGALSRGHSKPKDAGNDCPSCTTAPLSELQKAVAVEWERVLGLPAGIISAHDSFLELGGESLLALRACSSLQYAFGRIPPSKQDEEPQFGMLDGPFAVAYLLQAPSLEAYCSHLEKNGCSADEINFKGRSSSVHKGNGETIKDASRCDASWLAVCRAARQIDAGAEGRLEHLLDSMAREDAQYLCGSASRAAARTPRFTALHAAAQAGAEACVRLLLQRKARPTVVEGGASMTPAHYAAMNSPSCLKLLLSAKAPITVRDGRGQSLIHSAARAGNVGSLHTLLGTLRQSQGGDGKSARALRSGQGTRGLLEWTDRWARTAVHWGAMNGHDEALIVLLQCGASPEPPLITEHQMGKRTHLMQESPAVLAARVHGVGSSTASLLNEAVSARNSGCVKSVDVATAAATAAGAIHEEAAPSYLITIAEPRLVRLAIWELKERLQASVRREQCRVFFESSATPQSFMGLKAAEKVCAVLAYITGNELSGLAEVCTGETPEKAAAIFILNATPWQQGIATWHRFHGNEANTEELTFKVTCRRKGTRFSHIPSQGLAVALASALQAKMGWRAQVRRPDLEVRVQLGDAELMVDVPLLFQAAMRTGGGEICEAGLSAPVAWALARTAELRPGDRFLDPMCGKGVVLVEASLCWPSCQYLGVEIDESQLQGALRNLGILAGGGRIELVHGDARRLPLPDDCVDVIVCDIPFGKQYSTVEECRSGLYDAILEEFDRVIPKSSGRMVILTSLEQEAWVLRAAGYACPEGQMSGNQPSHACPPWVCIGRRQTPLGLLEAVILAFRRPTASERSADSSPKLPELSDRLWWETNAGRGDWASLKVSQRPPMQLARGREI